MIIIWTVACRKLDFFGHYDLWYEMEVLWREITFLIITEGFLTPHLFHSTRRMSWGSIRVFKAAKFFKELNFSGFSRCFSFKLDLNNYDILWRYFEVCSIMAEQQWLKPRKLNFLINSASLDTNWLTIHMNSGNIFTFSLCFEPWQ